VLRRGKRSTNDGPFKAEMPAPGVLASGGTKQDEKQYRKDVPNEMGTDSARQIHLVELRRPLSHSELHGKSMSEQEQIVRVDDRAAAGYDGVYRRELRYLGIYVNICHVFLENPASSSSQRRSNALQP
jgi:hypothetical protein